MLSSMLTQDEMNILIRVCEEPEKAANTEKTMQDYISRIRKKDNVSDLRELANKLKEEKAYK